MGLAIYSRSTTAVTNDIWLNSKRDYFTVSVGMPSVPWILINLEYKLGGTY